MLLQNSILLALGLATFACTSCGTVSKLMHKTKQEKPAEAAKEEPPKQDMAIGLVEVVNPEQQFVLVRTESRMTLPPAPSSLPSPRLATRRHSSSHRSPNRTSSPQTSWKASPSAGMW